MVTLPYAWSHSCCFHMELPPIAVVVCKAKKVCREPKLVVSARMLVLQHFEWLYQMGKRAGAKSKKGGKQPNKKRREQQGDSASSTDATPSLGDFAAFPEEVVDLILGHLDSSSRSRMHRVCKRLRWALMRQRLHELGYLGALLSTAQKLLAEPDPPAVANNNIHPLLPQPAPQKAAAAGEQQARPEVVDLVDEDEAPAAAQAGGVVWDPMADAPVAAERKLEVIVDTRDGSRYCSMNCLLTSDGQRQHVEELLVKGMLQEQNILKEKAERLRCQWQLLQPTYELQADHQVAVRFRFTLTVHTSELEAVQQRLLKGGICDVIERLMPHRTSVSISVAHKINGWSKEFMSQRLQGKTHPQLAPRAYQKGFMLADIDAAEIKQDVKHVFNTLF